MMGNKFLTFINNFYCQNVIPATSASISEYCISNSQKSNEIKKEVKNDKDHDAFTVFRKQHLKNVILGYLNINSLLNELDSISELIKGMEDIFLKNKTKLDETFWCMESGPNWYQIGNKTCYIPKVSKF